jgi:hypothetical protein
MSTLKIIDNNLLIDDKTNAIRIHSQSGSPLVVLSVPNHLIDEKELPADLKYDYGQEKNLIEDLVSHASFQRLMLGRDNDYRVVSVAQYQEELNTLYDFLEKRNVSKDVLKYFFVGSDESNSYYNGNPDPIVKMLPNPYFSTISTICLKKQKFSLVVTDYTVHNKYSALLEDFDAKSEELAECKDKDFVKKHLGAAKKDLTDFEKKNSVALTQTEKNLEVFNKFLEVSNLLDSYNTYELVTPQNTKKNKIK